MRRPPPHLLSRLVRSLLLRSDPLRPPRGLTHYNTVYFRGRSQHPLGLSYTGRHPFRPAPFFWGPIFLHAVLGYVKALLAPNTQLKPFLLRRPRRPLQIGPSCSDTLMERRQKLRSKKGLNRGRLCRGLATLPLCLFFFSHSMH